ncbi:MAG: hypothetical protein HY549_10755, partial [Elusimicrobia bacterium]|nr:hypothetical protein [Elusimicrobiota bacterium]
CPAASAVLSTPWVPGPETPGLSGKTAEQRAAEAQAAAMAAKAEEERLRKEEEAAAKESPTPAVDPKALLAMAGKPEESGPKGSFQNKIGALSSSLSAAAASGGSANALTGGPGLSGGIGRSFDAMGPRPGDSRAFGQDREPGKAAARAARVGSGGRGLARRQLMQARSLSVQAQQGNPEFRASTADRPFSNNPAADTAVTGPGVSDPGLPSSDGSAAATGGGGPTSEPSAGYSAPANSSPPPTPRAKDVSPWRIVSNLAKILLAVGQVLLIAAFIFGVKAKMTGPTGAIYQTIAMYLAYAASAIGAIVALLGMVVMGMGQVFQGLIYTLSGAFLGVSGFMAAQGIKQADISTPSKSIWEAIKGLIGGGSGSAGGMPATEQAHGNTISTSFMDLG